MEPDQLAGTFYEIIDGQVITYDARKKRKERTPFQEFLTKQVRFDHLKEEDLPYV